MRDLTQVRAMLAQLIAGASPAELTEAIGLLESAKASAMARLFIPQQAVSLTATLPPELITALFDRLAPEDLERVRERGLGAALRPKSRKAITEGGPEAKG